VLQVKKKGKNMNEIQELQAQRNAITAKIAVIEREGALSNSSLFVEEILNLLGEVGDGFIREDGYSSRRYSSAIAGVKNIRINNYDIPTVEVKIYGVEGYLLPETVEIPRYGKFTVKIIRSQRYG